MTLHVTAHAIQRYQERCEPCSDEAARAALLRLTMVAGNFAGLSECFVRLATGQRIAVRDGAITTVLPAENYRTHIRRVGRGRYG